MKWIKYTLLILVVLSATVFYLIVWGGPIKKTLTVGNCTVSYTYFLTDNTYCNWKTHGHCPTNSATITNVKREVALCLCEKQQEVTSKQMIELVNSDPYLMQDYERLKSEHNIHEDSVKTICNYKEILFQRYYIE